MVNTTIARDGARVSLYFVSLVATFIQYVLPWLLLAVGCWLFLLSVRELASGREVAPWFFLTWNVNRTRAVAFVFGILGVGYGLQQRNLRMAAVNRLKARISTLEQNVPSAGTPDR